MDDCRVLLGHNRYGTQGSNSDDSNAHPFTYGDITMVHNGTLTSRTGLKNHHIVDSCALAMEIADTKPEQYTKLLEKIQGAYVLVWVNRETKRVYFARNDERPLFLISCFKSKTIMFASEKWMLDHLLMHQKAAKHIDLDATGKVPLMNSLPVGKLISMSYEDAEKITPHEVAFTPAPKPTTTYTPRTTTIYGTGTTNLGVGGNSIPFNTRANTMMGRDEDTPFEAPFKKGEHIYAEKWQYYPPAGKKSRSKNKGSIRGICSTHPNVSFSVGNVSSHKLTQLNQAWNEWHESTILTKGTEIEILLEGKITSISQVKSQNVWVVNLAPTSLKVEGYDIENYDDDLEAPDEPEGNEEKKNLPVSINGQSNPLLSVDNKHFKVGNIEVDAATWLEASANGCCSCGADINLPQHTTVIWISTISEGKEELEPMCYKCQTKDKLN